LSSGIGAYDTGILSSSWQARAYPKICIAYANFRELPLNGQEKENMPLRLK